MKIEKIGGTHLLLRSEANNVLNIIPLASYVAYHTTKETSVVISSKATNQSLKNSIRIKAENVTSIGGLVFSGDRVHLLNELAILMGGCCQSVVLPLSLVASIQKVNATDFEIKVVVSNDLDNAVTKVHFAFDDYEGADPEPDDAYLLENPVINGTTKTFATTMGFSDPATAVGEDYSIIVDLIDVSEANLHNETVSVTVLAVS